MPIANATIIFQAVPLTVTAGAALSSAKRSAGGGGCDRRRIPRRGDGHPSGTERFDVFGLLVLVSVLFVSLRDLSTQAMPAAIPGLLIALSTALAVDDHGRG